MAVTDPPEAESSFFWTFFRLMLPVETLSPSWTSERVLYGAWPLAKWRHYSSVLGE